MDRTEAMKIVGKHVYVVTALNGEYIGICKEIITPKGNPWRANVEIKAVFIYPVIGFGEGMRYKRRRPFEEGRIINVRNCSVELLKDDENIPNYEDSVKTALEKSIKTLEEHVEHDKQIGKKDWLIIKWLEVLKERKLEITQEEPIAFKQEFDGIGYSDGSGTLILDDVLSVGGEEFTISRNAIVDGEEMIKQQEYEFDTVVYSLRDMLFLQHVASIFGKKRVEAI